ncbi:hypothetical protein BD410DRAFT_801780 [Rickenella mellea]|uniref:Uncharacterized protein n=1 Tax=Rickenella mellea TaxID=50990 RepID=A0A4Y7QA06_9AGAM|nr:hypothetical protein BD410DRAFT_801780 [Rickenella mellea]
MTLTARVDRVTADGAGAMVQSLAEKAILNASYPTLTWSPVAADAGRYFVNAWVTDGTPTTNEVATMLFDVQAGPDRSCLLAIPTLTQIAPVPPVTATATSTATSMSTSAPSSSIFHFLSTREGRMIGIIIGASVLGLLVAILVGICIVRRCARRRRMDKRKLQPYAFASSISPRTPLMTETDWEQSASSAEVIRKGSLGPNVLTFPRVTHDNWSEYKLGSRFSL